MNTTQKPEKYPCRNENGTKDVDFGIDIPQDVRLMVNVPLTVQSGLLPVGRYCQVPLAISD
jgi:hypothetical protein